MAKGDEDSGPEEAKGIAQTFLGTFGVVDIVLGGLALYALHVASFSRMANLKSTGVPFADNALLVCAAALSGKLVCLLASALPAVLNARSKSMKELQNLVEKYEALHPVESSEESMERVTMHDAEDRALSYLEHERAPVARRCEVVRDNAIFAYGAVPITLAMFVATKPKAIAIALASLGFFIFGWFTYNDFVGRLCLSLRGFVIRTRATDASSGSHLAERDP